MTGEAGSPGALAGGGVSWMGARRSRSLCCADCEEMSLPKAAFGKLAATESRWAGRRLLCSRQERCLGEGRQALNAADDRSWLGCIEGDAVSIEMVRGTCDLSVPDIQTLIRPVGSSGVAG